MIVEDFILRLKPYEGGKPIEELKRELGIDGDIIKLASNENPLGASRKAVEAIRKSAENVYLYPDGNSYYLKKKMSEKLGVEEDNIIFGNGSDELLELIYRTFATKKEDEILYCYPTFIEYKLIGMAFNKKIKELPLKNYRYDIDALIENINENTRIIFLNTPNNPTGTIIKRNDIESIIEKVNSSCLVVIDEAYYEYAIKEDDYEELLDLYKNNNVIILRTFSKAYGLAGLRIGYGIAQSEIIGFLNRTRPPFNVNLLAQEAAIAALDDSEHINKSVELNRQGKEFLYYEFNKMGIDYVKTYSNFILFDVKKDANYVYEELLKKGVIVRSMAGYGYKTSLRVTIGTLKENETFINRLKEVLGV